MPRKSSASLSVVAPLVQAPRLRPPDALSAAERAVWAGIVDSLPPGWFHPAHAAVLEQLCRHKARADELEGVLAGMDPRSDRAGYTGIAKLIQAETTRIIAAARACRLTPRSLLKAETAANRAAGAKPAPRGIDALFEGR